MELEPITRQAKIIAGQDLTPITRTEMILKQFGGGAGSMDLRVADGYVQYSRDGGMTWTNLIAMADLKGADGITPHIGDNGNWYLGENDTGKPSRGATGAKGEPGTPGNDGHTPVKGTDYWTAADKAEIVADTLAALPKWTGGSY